MTERLPTPGSDNNTWGVILNGFLGVAHNADGTLIGVYRGAGTPEGAVTAPIGSIYQRSDGGADTAVYRKESGAGNTGWVADSSAATTGFPSSSARIYVSPNGTDSEDGLSERNAVETLAVALAKVPALGGLIVLDDGDYDVYNGGAGLALDRTKSIIFKSAIENPRFSVRYDLIFGPGPRIYSSGGPIANGLINSISDGGTMPIGGGFDGLHFDLTDGTPYGAYLEDVIHPFMANCSGVGPNTQTVEQWLLKSQDSDTYKQDCSWWRVFRNYARNAGLCDFGSATTNTNCNQNVVAFNACFNGALNVGAIRFRRTTRCATYSNNLETIAAPGSPIVLDRCYGGSFVGDAGEGTGITFLKTTNGSGNLYAPIGSASTPLSTDYLIDSSGDSGSSIVEAASAGYNARYTPAQVKVFPETEVRYAGGTLDPLVAKTGDYTARTSDKFITVDSTAAPYTVTLPTAVGSAGKAYTVKKIDSSANAVAIATTSSQTIDGGASASLAARWDSITVVSNGTNWIITPTIPAVTPPIATDVIWDAKGDLAVGTGANAASKLAVGANDLVLTAASGEATGLKWAAAAGGGGSVATDAIFDAKGDLPIGTGADTAARLAIGANYIDELIPDSTTATGVRWGRRRPGIIRSGAIVETIPRNYPLVNSGVLSQKRPGMYAIDLPLGCVITNITFFSGTTPLNTGVHQFFGLYSAARARLAVTGDGADTAWGAYAEKTLAIAGGAYTTVVSGLHYLGILVEATTVPSLICNVGSVYATGLAPILSGYTTDYVSALPDPAAAITASGGIAYAYVS